MLGEENTERLSLLRKLYYEKGSPSYLSGANKLYNEAKKIDSLISHKDVNAFLTRQRVYQLHAQSGKRPVLFPKILASAPWQLMQCDLAFFNKNSQIFLIGTDIFSGYTLAIFLGRKKTAKATANALLRMIKQIPGNPKIGCVSTDNGTEFAKWGKILKNLNIEYKTLKTFQKAAAAENRIGQIRALYRKYQSLTGKKDMKSIMPYIIKTINKRLSRVIQMSPLDALKLENQGLVFKRRYKKYLDKIDSEKFQMKHEFNIGQKVRVINYKNMSEMTTALKKPLTRFSSTIFTIYKRNEHQFPVTYKIIDENGIFIDKSIPAKFLIDSSKNE